MKTITYILRRIAPAVMLIAGLAACNEDPTFNQTERDVPQITSFSPAEGKVGTEITIEGEHLEYVDTVYIGGGLATLKYRVSSTELVVKVNAHSRTGSIVVQNSLGSAESTGHFTVTYALPVLSQLPATGRVNEEILIQGTDLEGVTHVLFGTAEAAVVYQTETELVVKVPYVEEDEVTVYLVYQTASGEAQVASSDKFRINKPQPVVTSYPLSADISTLIELTGENLTLIDQVWFGTVAGDIMDREDDRLTVLVPVVGESATVALTLVYYGDARLVLTEAFELNVPDAATILFYENVTTYCQDPNLTDNFFNASNGDIYGPCEYEAVKNDIDFFITYSSGNATIQLNNPKNSENQTKAFKCDNVALPTEVMPNEVKFRVFSADNDAQKKYIDLVRNKQLETISAQMLEEDGAVTISDGLITGLASAPATTCPVAIPSQTTMYCWL
ncbi:MAG: IPT/TIG domain-containing protein [Bacteroides sp.]|nr:IPT/TIG domain-containing protein [Bacteroides sp.]